MPFTPIEDPVLEAIVTRRMRYGQTRWAEVWSSFIILGLGVVLVYPWGGVPANALPWLTVILKHISPQNLGILAIVIGWMRLIALYVNGRMTITPLFRLIGCVAGFLFFGFLTVGMILVFPPLNTGVPVYLFLAMGELHSAGRCGRDMFAYDSLGTRQRSRENAKHPRLSA